MPQTQPPVSPVSSTRIRRRNWWDHQQARRPYVIGGGAAPGGQTNETTRFKSKAIRLASMGGQHRPPLGDTTQPTDAQVEWFNRELQRAIDAIDWSQPF
jgi:hypothetical protein